MHETGLIHHLFVYGSLRRTASSGFGRTERDRLYRSAVFVGQGVIEGTLLDLGDYPGLLETGTAGQVVTGDVLRLIAPQRPLFRWLDVYEGISEDGRCGEYQRVVRRVSLSGRAIACWVYVLRERPADVRGVASGDWLKASRKTRHR